MQVRLKYGEQGLELNFPETANFAGVLYPQEATPLADPAAAVQAALEEPHASQPLRELARGRRDAVIVISDITRPVPNPLLLPLITAELEAAGMPAEQITILIATGIHRPNEGAELERLVGAEVAARYRVINHFSKNQAEMEQVGTIGEGVPAYVNRRYLQADLKILTGFIEPHMWAGFSGGRKSILPGISSVKTLEFMHGPEMVAHPRTRYGVLEGNPFHEAGLAVMAMAGADFIVNVTLDTGKRVTGVFAGHPVKAHLQGVEFLSRHCVRQLEQPLDFVVTTNAGAPLDCNLYQSAKGLSGSLRRGARGGGDPDCDGMSGGIRQRGVPGGLRARHHAGGVHREADEEGVLPPRPVVRPGDLPGDAEERGLGLHPRHRRGDPEALPLPPGRGSRRGDRTAAAALRPGGPLGDRPGRTDADPAGGIGQGIRARPALP